VTLSAIGYKTLTVPARELNRQAPLQMNIQATSLSDVVVVPGKKIRHAARKALDSTYLAVADSADIVPLDGWGPYNTYVALNLALPNVVNDQNIHGAVTLSFEVDARGRPVNITVEKSLCDACDAEAIRLLQQGPSWKSGHKKTQKKFKVNF